jgi:hypothetical protein
MARKAFLVVGFALLLQFLGVMLLGPSTGGVELGQIPVPQPGADYQPGQLPPCVSAHTYARRAWPGLQMIGSDVWLVGCNDADGRLRISSGPTCQATSFLGRGTATCTASPSGSNLKVTVHINYPFGLDLLAGQPASTTFTLHPDGGYFAP